jgi:hypothetical protein
MAILALEAELPLGTGIVAMLQDELVIETDTSIAEKMLTLAKQKREESAGLVFKDVPMRRARLSIPGNSNSEQR